ncbi:MAG: hypothetical protein JNL01_10995 [Bdellovibrionales bacterium]|nr:hypothetical protein [Bdellovibrionales bacterium]
MLKSHIEQLLAMVVLGVLLTLQAACSPLAVSISKRGGSKDSGSSNSSGSSAPSNLLNASSWTVTYRLASYVAPERDLVDPRQSQALVQELNSQEIKDVLTRDYIEFNVPISDYKPKFTAVFEVTLTAEEIKELGLNESPLIQLNLLGTNSVMMKVDSKVSDKKLTALLNHTHSLKIYAECAD